MTVFFDYTQHCRIELYFKVSRFSATLSGCTLYSRHYSLDDAFAACTQRGGGLTQRRISYTTFQIPTSRRRCAKPLVSGCAFT